MPNRVIKDRIWTSLSLARLKPYYQDQWPRWLLLADDWGCFNADSNVIKGLAYPKRKERAKDILRIKETYYISGLLFLWQDEENREWGYFISWNNHQFCNASEVDSKGKYSKHRRKTPEPPKELLDKYLQDHFNKIRQVETKSLNPNPNPNPNPKHNPIISQIENLLGQFTNTTQEKIKVYMERVALKNKSKMITNGRRFTLLTELFNSKERCADDSLFEYAVEMAVNYDAPNIGYINAVIRNKKTNK